MRLPVLILRIHNGRVLVHHGVALSVRVAPLNATLATDAVNCARLVKEVKEAVLWGFPFDGQLLQVDHLVCVHDLLNQIVCLQLIHSSYIIVSRVVNFLETEEFALEIFEKFGEFLVVACELIVPSLGFLLLNEAVVSLVMHILLVLLGALV